MFFNEDLGTWDGPCRHVETTRRRRNPDLFGRREELYLHGHDFLQAGAHKEVQWSKIYRDLENELRRDAPPGSRPSQHGLFTVTVILTGTYTLQTFALVSSRVNLCEEDLVHDGLTCYPRATSILIRMDAQKKWACRRYVE